MRHRYHYYAQVHLPDGREARLDGVQDSPPVRDAASYAAFKRAILLAAQERSPKAFEFTRTDDLCLCNLTLLEALDD